MALMSEWEAFFEVEPQGEDRADWQTAVLTSAIYNTRQHWGKDSKAVEVKDCYGFLIHSMSAPDGQ